MTPVEPDAEKRLRELWTGLGVDPQKQEAILRDIVNTPPPTFGERPAVIALPDRSKA